MITFKLIRHLEIEERFQGINLTEFSYSSNNNTSNSRLLKTFIHSKHFTDESRRDIVKNHKETRPFLRQAFVADCINFNDFKELTKEGIIKFLDDYSNEDDWGDSDDTEFKILKNKFFDLISEVKADVFYIINKDWFDQEDNRIRNPEYSVYTYYFLILWIDKPKGTLTITEWTYD